MRRRRTENTIRHTQIVEVGLVGQTKRQNASFSISAICRVNNLICLAGLLRSTTGKHLLKRVFQRTNRRAAQGRSPRIQQYVAMNFEGEGDERRVWRKEILSLGRASVGDDEYGEVLPTRNCGLVGCGYFHVPRAARNTSLPEVPSPNRAHGTCFQPPVHAPSVILSDSDMPRSPCRASC